MGPEDLEEALAALEAEDERAARIVALRFLGGLSVAEVAEVLGVSERTVKGEWRVAGGWGGERG